jgi:hypothetical protein
VSGAWPVCASRNVLALMLAASTVPLSVASTRLPLPATPVVLVATVCWPLLGSVKVTLTGQVPGAGVTGGEPTGGGTGGTTGERWRRPVRPGPPG